MIILMIGKIKQICSQKIIAMLQIEATIWLLGLYASPTQCVGAFGQCGIFLIHIHFAAKASDILYMHSRYSSQSLLDIFSGWVVVKKLSDIPHKDRIGMENLSDTSQGMPSMFVQIL